jgi:hypothetical protein
MSIIKYFYVLLFVVPITTIFFNQGRDEVYTSSWFAFESLHFLLDKDTPRKSRSTVSG